MRKKGRMMKNQAGNSDKKIRKSKINN